MRSEVGPALPLGRWADRRLRQFAKECGSAAVAALSGAQLMGERAALNGFKVPGRVSAGGGCRLLATEDGWIALNLAREADRELLPALIGDAFDDYEDAAIAAHVCRSSSAALVTRGRLLGLAIADVAEQTVSPPIEVLAEGTLRRKPLRARPLVLDLSALWAGPLAGHLLWLTGAEVIKIESPRRPDALRQGDPALFARLNQGKANVALDLASAAGHDALLRLIARADAVIEAARPRALAQLGIDRARLVTEHPGLVWLTITGHGASDACAEWVAFGDDAAVAGGLTRALHRASGTIAFGGDAPADPLTGIVAAQQASRVLRSGRGQWIGLAMSGIVAMALREDRADEAAAQEAELIAWAEAEGAPFPAFATRAITGEVRDLGADTARRLSC